MKLLDRLMDGAHKYSVTDLGVLKFALLFAGILIGTYGSGFFGRHIVIIWFLAAMCYGYIVVSTLKKAGVFGKNSR